MKQDDVDYIQGLLCFILSNQTHGITADLWSMAAVLFIITPWVNKWRQRRRTL